jgi:hypothetical protein
VALLKIEMSVTTMTKMERNKPKEAAAVANSGDIGPGMFEEEVQERIQENNPSVERKATMKSNCPNTRIPERTEVHAGVDVVDHLEVEDSAEVVVAASEAAAMVVLEVVIAAVIVVHHVEDLKVDTDLAEDLQEADEDSEEETVAEAAVVDVA